MDGRGLSGIMQQMPLASQSVELEKRPRGRPRKGLQSVRFQDRHKNMAAEHTQQDVAQCHDIYRPVLVRKSRTTSLFGQKM